MIRSREVVGLDEDVFAQRVGAERWKVQIDDAVVVRVHPELLPDVEKAVVVRVEAGLPADVRVVATEIEARPAAVLRPVDVAAPLSGSGIHIELDRVTVTDFQIGFVIEEGVGIEDLDLDVHRLSGRYLLRERPGRLDVAVGDPVEIPEQHQRNDQTGGRRIVARSVAALLVALPHAVDRHVGVEVADDTDADVLVDVKLPQLREVQLERHRRWLRARGRCPHRDSEC